MRSLCMTKTGTDGRDVRRGAYDPVITNGMPQPEQVNEKTSPDQAAQHGADVRGDACPARNRSFPKALPAPDNTL